MESNKEFISRMMVMFNELPESKKRDLFALLAFLDVQLILRDNEFVEHFIDKLDLYLLEKVDWYGKAATKKQIREEIRNFGKANTHSFTFHANNKEEVQQVLGSEKDK